MFQHSPHSLYAGDWLWDIQGKEVLAGKEQVRVDQAIANPFEFYYTHDIAPTVGALPGVKMVTS